MRKFWCAAIALTLCTPEASAQTSGHSTAAPLGNVKPFRELRAFGACYAKSHRKAALLLLATVPDTADEVKAFHRMVYGEDVAGTICLSGGTRMRMPTLFARGAIAEGLLLAGGVPDTHRLSAPGPGQVRDLHGAARCYAAGHRGEVEALLKINPGSPEEVKAVAGLWNDFRTCMPGFNVRLNAPWIRFLLAEALLRLPPAPQPGT
ncbi:MAG TPA: hypothetical protein VEZ48_14420 [Sphingomonadaceae bacterium]|nr:hypothetical protein [Sphingomonadaceae bacterium]